jgi:hypothetical protein
MRAHGLTNLKRTRDRVAGGKTPENTGFRRTLRKISAGIIVVVELRRLELRAMPAVANELVSVRSQLAPANRRF